MSSPGNTSELCLIRVKLLVFVVDGARRDVTGGPRRQVAGVERRTVIVGPASRHELGVLPAWLRLRLRLVRRRDGRRGWWRGGGLVELALKRLFLFVACFGGAAGGPFLALALGTHFFLALTDGGKPRLFGLCRFLGLFALDASLFFGSLCLLRFRGLFSLRAFEPFLFRGAPSRFLGVEPRAGAFHRRLVDHRGGGGRGGLRNRHGRGGLACRRRWRGRGRGWRHGRFRRRRRFPGRHGCRRTDFGDGRRSLRVGEFQIGV